MFGYLTPYREQMTEEDRETYEAYYCGLCETLGRLYGSRGKLVLAYDLVFLALLYDGLYEDEEERRTALCLYKGARVQKVRTAPLTFAARVNLMLSYQNYRDKAHDSGSRKAKIAASALKKAYEKTGQELPRAAEALAKYMAALHGEEEHPSGNPDLAANLTGEMLSEVFLMKDDEYARYLRPMFYYLGKYIYLCDAFTDVFDDLASGSYNPYRDIANEAGFTKKAREHLESVISECARCFEMLPIFRHREILRNVLYSGVWMHFSQAVKDRGKKKDKA